MTRSPGYAEPTIHRKPGCEQSELRQRHPTFRELLEQHGHFYVELRSALWRNGGQRSGYAQPKRRLVRGRLRIAVVMRSSLFVHSGMAACSIAFRILLLS